MDYRTGDNPHEPVTDDKRSRAWLFILRGSYYPKSPEAFLPHVNHCAWIATRVGRFDRWLLRGVIITDNPRNYRTLKTRYSKLCEWIPILPLRQKHIVEEFTIRPIPVGSYRWVAQNPTPTPLHKVGYYVTVPDLIEDYEAAIWLAEQEGAQDVIPDREPLVFVPPPPSGPLPDEEFWQDMPDGSLMFIGRFYKGELRFDLPDE